MITGMHVLLFSRQANAVQKFFSEVLEMRSVDAGEGWPIFAAPPTELAMHETGGERLGLYEPHHPSPLASVSNQGAGE